MSLLFFVVVVVALINLKPMEVDRLVVKEVPIIVVKERVVVKEVMKDTPVVYKTVNHHHNDNRNVVYYQPEEPRVQRVSYNYYEPVNEEMEVTPKEINEVKPRVKMFFVDGISEPLWVEGGSDD